MKVTVLEAWALKTAVGGARGRADPKPGDFTESYSARSSGHILDKIVVASGCNHFVIGLRVSVADRKMRLR